MSYYNLFLYLNGLRLIFLLCWPYPGLVASHFFKDLWFLVRKDGTERRPECVSAVQILVTPADLSARDEAYMHDYVYIYMCIISTYIWVGICT